MVSSHLSRRRTKACVITQGSVLIEKAVERPGTLAKKNLPSTPGSQAEMDPADRQNRNPKATVNVVWVFSFGPLLKNIALFELSCRASNRTTFFAPHR